MCGIFGWFGAAPAQADRHVRLLSRLLRHRGPDDHGYEVGPGWGFGFRRLSILDLSPLGHQPMRSPDGRFWIVFNGEIYNFVELRAALERKGERFRGGSDTEVLLRLLAREGAAALGRLNGMFALALVDTVERTFLLARDRLGVKPLYFHQRPGQLRFASELKALLAWPDAPRELDPVAVVEYLALDFLSNERTIFKGYAKLPPGHFLAGALDAPEHARLQPYWRLTLNPEIGKRELAPHQLEELRGLLTDATRIRLRSDVPVGVFLSGGLDSGLVATLAARAAEGSRPLALTVGFAERKYDETTLAQSTAAWAGLEQRVLSQQPGGLATVDRLAWFYDEPFGDASALPTFALCEAAAAHATVFLSGDGGDEAFGGYHRYVDAYRRRWLTLLPPPAAWALRALSQHLPISSSWHFRLLRSGLRNAGFAATYHRLPEDPLLRSVLSPDLGAIADGVAQAFWQRWEAIRGQSLLARQQALDYGLYLPDDVLVKVDRASMAHSIEVRSPLLDYRVVEWAARLPRAALLDARRGKLPLRALARRLLPASVQAGAKRGFGVPMRTWFRQPAGERLARERLLSDEARRRGFWDLSAVEGLITAQAAHREGVRDFGPLLWRLLMLDAWARLYLESTDFLQGPPPPFRESARSPQESAETP